jgi:hypothetical protein
MYVLDHNYSKINIILSMFKRLYIKVKVHSLKERLSKYKVNSLSDSIFSKHYVLYISMLNEFFYICSFKKPFIINPLLIKIFSIL